MTGDTMSGAAPAPISGADIRTFLFADMRGYTRFTQEHGDDAASALAGRFADLVKEAVPEFEGELLELRGDEALCVFRSARQAFRASVELQRRLRTGTDEEAAFPIGVGMGLDAGEAVPTHGGYRGASLNLAARLCALAKPGEILASETVVGLASRVEGMRFLGGRSASLKGMPRPVRYVVVEPERPLPPLPVASAPPRGRSRMLLAVVGTVAIVVGIGVFFATRSGGVGGRETVAANAAGLIDWPSGTVAAAVPVAGRPGGVAVGGGFVWVTDSVNGKLLKIDPTKNLVIDQVLVGANPTGVVVGGGAVWVANSQAGTISRVNLKTSTVVQNVRVGNGPTSLAFGGGSVWALNSVDATVSRIAASSGRVSPAIPLNQNPSGIAYGLGSVWVTSQEAGLLLRIDPTTNEVVQSIPVGNGPVGVAVGGGAVWVANVADRTVSRVDVGSGAVGKIALPGAPQELAFTNAGLWSGDTASGTVTLIRNSTVTRTIHIGSDPLTLAGDTTGLWVGTVASVASHRGGTLRVVSQGVDSQGNDTFDSIDPGAAFRVQSWQVLTITNDGLVGFKHVGGPAGLTLVPDLATSLPVVSDGGKTYTFQLRSGIRYSNGQVVRAQDFRYAIQRELQADSGFAFSGVQLVGSQACSPKACDLSKGIVTDDRTGTIVFHLAQPDPDFLFQLALPWGDAVPTGSPKIDLAHPLTHPLPATGPYKISLFVPHKRLVLARNPYFHEWSGDAQPNGFPNRLVWHFGLTPDAETTAVEQGRADIMVDSPPPQRLGEIAVRFPAQAHPFVEPTTYYLFLNTRIPPFSNPLAREAASLAVNRETVVRLWGGDQLARPTCQVLPPGIQGYRPYCPYTIDPNASGNWKGPDMAKAKRLIASSGTKGEPVTVQTNADDPVRVRIALYISHLLQRLGYRASVHKYPDEQTYYTQVGHLSTHAQIGLQGWESNFPRGSDFFTNLFTCSSYTPTAPVNINTAGFCNHRIDKQIKLVQRLQIPKPASAAKLWARVDHEVVDQAPDVFLFNRSGIDLTSTRVGNYQRNAQLAVLLDQLWVR